MIPNRFLEQVEAARVNSEDRGHNPVEHFSRPRTMIEVGPVVDPAGVVQKCEKANNGQVAPLLSAIFSPKASTLCQWLGPWMECAPHLKMDITCSRIPASQASGGFFTFAIRRTLFLIFLCFSPVLRNSIGINLCCQRRLCFPEMGTLAVLDSMRFFSGGGTKVY